VLSFFCVAASHTAATAAMKPHKYVWSGTLGNTERLKGKNIFPKYISESGIPFIKPRPSYPPVWSMDSGTPLNAEESKEIL